VVDAFAARSAKGGWRPARACRRTGKLAAQEGLALVTASRVYAELQAMGLVSGETGRGTFVRESLLPRHLGIDQHAAASGMVDLNFNYPSLPGQAEMLRDGLRQLAASGDLEALLRYQPHGGRPHERAIVARHLAARGLTVNAEQVMIVSGAQHGLADRHGAAATRRRGRGRCADLSGFKVLAEAHRLELAPIPAAGHGPDLDALERLCKRRRVRAVYAMPTLHNPLGWVMGASRRRQLVAIARRHGLLIIEDAAYAFLAEDAPAPLAALAPEIDGLCLGLSKSMATGLRVGFVAAPAEWVPGIERAIRATTWNTPSVMTALACGWLADGTVTRLEAEKRRDAMARQAIAADVFARMRCVRHPSSYFVWLPLPEEVRADQVATALMRDGSRCRRPNRSRPPPRCRTRSAWRWGRSTWTRCAMRCRRSGARYDGFHFPPHPAGREPDGVFQPLGRL
jgi:DNA-binding transcriptional MocR family regulator